MSSIKRLLVVSTEDSTKLSSWSNVPYLFCKNLESQGVVLHRYTLKESMFLRRLVYGAQKILGLFGGRASAWSYSRSRLYFWSARRQIDHALQNAEVDGVLVLNFSYGPSLPLNKPLFMFCDWTYGYAVERLRDRSPDKYEKSSIEREHDLIEAADEVFVLFPLAEQYIRNVRPKARTHYLGNVINAVEVPSEDDLKQKLESYSLLFIGKPHYIEGAKRLIAAYIDIKPRFPQLRVDIIGIDSHFFESLPPGVSCHGYLDKGDDAQREQYYQLLRRARLYVNTTPGWASFSATLEALYFYTPIITSRYPEIVETLGFDLSFGAYFEEDGESLSRLIERYLEDAGFEATAIRSHELARSFGWARYIEKFLAIANASFTLKAARY